MMLEEQKLHVATWAIAGRAPAKQACGSAGNGEKNLHPHKKK
jgi:hypothetical protein